MNHLPFLFWLGVILASNAVTWTLMLCRRAPIMPYCMECPLLRAAKRVGWSPGGLACRQDLENAVNTIIDTGEF